MNHQQRQLRCLILEMLDYMARELQDPANEALTLGRNDPVALSKIGTNLAVANHYCWPNYTLGANGWYSLSLYADGANIVGAGIRTHGDERVTLTDDYPGESSDWEIKVYNWEDHDVTFDVYAWFS